MITIYVLLYTYPHAECVSGIKIFFDKFIIAFCCCFCCCCGRMCKDLVYRYWSVDVIAGIQIYLFDFVNHISFIDKSFSGLSRW